MRWDPTQYARYSDHRSRPFFDLVTQIGAESPDTVIDVGCGSGELTVTLAQRWPATTLLGLDSSPEMIGVRGTGLRPVLEVLSDDEADAFNAEYAALLRLAYPQRTYGTVFPFLRTFAVAHKTT